jgi:excisionase family DNA binding protein
VTITTAQAAAALGIPARTLRRYLAAGAIVGHRILHAQPWRVPTAEVARAADALGITPDWRRVTDLADLANVANARTSRATRRRIDP